MIPSYKNFRGVVMSLADNKYVTHGEVAIVDDNTIEITELPVKTWTQNYKEEVIEPMLNGTEKVPACITDYKEYHTDATVKFVVKVTPEKLSQMEQTGLHKVFKLQTSLSTSTMVLFDANGVIKRYSCVEDILKDFFAVRLELYKKRKDYLEGMLAAESLKYDNIARFILEKIEGTITVENKKKKDLIEMMVRRGYDPDPVKAWKDVQNKAKLQLDDETEPDEEETSSGQDFNYILGMPLWNLTKEKKDELLQKKEAKAKELTDLRKKSPNDLWRDDLDLFVTELDRVEQQERDDATSGDKKQKAAAKGNRAKKLLQEAQPSPTGRRVEPRIDSAMKKKADAEVLKKMKAKGKKEERNGSILDYMKIEDEDTNTEPMSLADRLKIKGSPVDAIKKEKKAKEPKQPKEPKEPKEPRQPKVPRAKKSSVSPKKKGGKKQNPWSDSESDVETDLSDEELDGSFMETFIPRETAPARRAAAAKVSYKFDDDEEDALPDPSDGDLSDDDSMFVPEKKKTLPAKKAAVIDSDSEVEAAPEPKSSSSPPDPDDVWLKITGQTPTEDKNSTASSSQSKPDAPMFDDTDDEAQDSAPKEELFKPYEPLKPAAKKKAPAKKANGEKKAAPKRPRAKKADKADKPSKTKKRQAKFGSDLSDSSFDDIPVKKSKPAKKKKASSDESGSDVDMDFVSTAVAPVSRGGRAKAPVKYNFGESDDEDFE